MNNDILAVLVVMIGGFFITMFILLITPEMRQSIRNIWYVSKIKREMLEAEKGVPDIPDYDDDDE